MLPWYMQEYWPVYMNVNLRIIHHETRGYEARAARLAAKIRAGTGVEARLERGTRGQFDVVMDGETIASRERAFLKRLFGEEWHFREGDWLFRRGSFLERLFDQRWGLFEAAVAGAVKGRLDPRQLARRSRLAQEMRLTLEIIPGRAIGPFRLGMTFQEIEDTLRSLYSEPVTLNDGCSSFGTTPQPLVFRSPRGNRISLGQGVGIVEIRRVIGQRGGALLHRVALFRAQSLQGLVET